MGLIQRPIEAPRTHGCAPAAERDSLFTSPSNLLFILQHVTTKRVWPLLLFLLRYEYVLSWCCLSNKSKNGCLPSASTADGVHSNVDDNVVRVLATLFAEIDSCGVIASRKQRAPSHNSVNICICRVS